MEDIKIYVYDGVTYEVSAAKEEKFLKDHPNAVLQINKDSQFEEYKVPGIDSIYEVSEKNKKKFLKDYPNAALHKDIIQTKEADQSQDNQENIYEDINKGLSDMSGFDIYKNSTGNDYNSYLSSRPNIQLHYGNAEDWFRHAIENGMPLDGKNSRNDNMILSQVFKGGGAYNPHTGVIKFRTNHKTGEEQFSHKMPNNSNQIYTELLELHKKNKAENWDKMSSEDKRSWQFDQGKKTAEYNFDIKERDAEKQLEKRYKDELVYDPSINVKSSTNYTTYVNLANDGVELERWPDEILTLKNSPKWFKGSSAQSWINSGLHGYGGQTKTDRAEYLREKIYSGKWGYNPHTDTLHKLEESFKVSEKDKWQSSPFGAFNKIDKKNKDYDVFTKGQVDLPPLADPNILTKLESKSLEMMQEKYYKYGFEFEQEWTWNNAVKIIKPGGDPDGKRYYRGDHKKNIDNYDYIIVATNWGGKYKSGAIDNASLMDEFIGLYAEAGKSNLDQVRDRVEAEIQLKDFGLDYRTDLNLASSDIDDLKEKWGMNDKSDAHVLDLYTQVTDLLDAGSDVDFRDTQQFKSISLDEAKELGKLIGVKDDDTLDSSENPFTYFEGDDFADKLAGINSQKGAELLVEGEDQYKNQLALTEYIKQFYNGNADKFYAENNDRDIQKLISSPGDFKDIRNNLEIDSNESRVYGEKYSDQVLYLEAYDKALRDDIKYLSANWFMKPEIQKILNSEAKVDLSEIKKESAEKLVEIKSVHLDIEKDVEEITKISSDIDDVQNDEERLNTISLIASQYNLTDINQFVDNEGALMKLSRIDPKFAELLLKYNTKVDEVSAKTSLYNKKNKELDELNLNESELMLMVDALKRNHEPGTAFSKGAWNTTVDIVQALTLDLPDAYLKLNLHLAGGKENLRNSTDPVISAFISASDAIESESERWDKRQETYRETWRKPMDFGSIENLSDLMDWGTHMTGEQLPMLGIVVATGGTGVAVLGTYAGTEKWKTLDKADRLADEIGYEGYDPVTGLYAQDHSALSMYSNAVLTGASEYLLERYITLPQVNAFKRGFNTPQGKLGFDNAIKREVFTIPNISRGTGLYILDAGLESFSEGGAALSSNFFDIYISGIEGVSIYDNVLEGMASGWTISSGLKIPAMGRMMLSPFASKDYNQRIGENSMKVEELIKELGPEFKNFHTSTANTITIEKNGQKTEVPINPVYDDVSGQMVYTDPPAYKINNKDVSRKEMVNFILDGALKGKDGSYTISNDRQVQDLMNADPETQKKLAKIINLIDTNVDLLENEIKRVDVLTDAEKKILIDNHKLDLLDRQEAQEILKDNKLNQKEKDDKIAVLQNNVDIRADEKEKILNKYKKEEIQLKYEQSLNVIKEMNKEANEMGGPKVEIKTLKQKDFSEEVKKYEIGDGDMSSKALENITAEKEGIVQGLNEIINDKNSTPEEIQDAKEKLKNPQAVVDMASNILNNSDYGVMQPKVDKNGNISEINILINEDAAVEDGVFSTAAHEFIHASFANTLKFDPKMREVLGEQLVNLFTSGDVQFKSIRKRREFNKRINQYESNKQGEEALAIISEMMLAGDVKLKTNALQDLKGIFRRFSHNYLGVPITFNKTKDIKNFIIDYNKSIANNRPSKAIAKMLAKGANGKMFKDARTPAQRKGMANFSKAVKKNIESNPDLKSEFDNLVQNNDGTKKHENNDDFKLSPDYIKGYEQIVDSKLLDGLIQQGMTERGLPPDALRDFTRKVKEELGLRYLNNFNLDKNTSLFGWLTGVSGGQGMSIIYRAKGDVIKEYLKQAEGDKTSIDKVINESTTIADTIEADKDSLIEDIENADLSATAKTKAKNNVNDLIMVLDLLEFSNKVKKAIADNINDTYIPIEDLTYRSIRELLLATEGKATTEKKITPTGPLFETLNAISSEIGIDPLRILAKQDLNKEQRELAQKWIFDKAINEDGSLNNNIIKALPEGTDLDGKATGVANTKLGQLYTKGERAKYKKGATAAGLATQTKRTNITKEELLDLFGINPDGSLQPGTKADGAIRELTVQIAQLAANQEIRLNAIENDLATAAIIAKLGLGKSEQMFSKREQAVKNIKETESTFQVDERFEGIDFKNINTLLKNTIKDSVYKHKTKAEIDEFFDKVEKIWMPILPKGFITKTVIRPSNRILPNKGKDLIKVGNKKISIDKYFTDKRNKLLAKLNLKYGKEFEGDGVNFKYGKTFAKMYGVTESDIKKNIDNGTAERFNKINSSMHQQFWQRVYNDIKNNPMNIKAWGNYFVLVGQDVKHPHRMVPFAGYSKNPKGHKGKKYEWEHSMQATRSYLYLLNAIAKGYDFNTSYELVMKDSFVFALDANDNLKLTNAKRGTSMGKDWSLLDNSWLDRYFHPEVETIRGGINPDNQIYINGKTFSEEFNINASGDIRIAQEFSKRQSNKNINEAFNNKIDKAIKGEKRGMSTFDFDDTLARTKSGVRYTTPNAEGTPAPGRKVIFLAGSAGSGKSNVIKQLGLEKQGYKIVNQDIALEWLVKNSGLPTDMRDFTPEQASKWGSLQWEARDIAQRKQMKFQGRGDGIVIDGTGASSISLGTQLMKFKNAGYDAHMIFVESSLETALVRNKARKERSLKDFIVERNWKAVQKNKKVFKEDFKENFAEVNTDKLKQGDAMPLSLVDKIDRFTNSYIKGRLTAEEFANKGSELKDQGAEFDFSEFNKVVDGTPGPLLDKAKARAEKYGTKDMFVLTARPQASAQPIQEFLQSQGLNIPLKNITGLANSTGEAKAMWMVEKFAEGYNDMYFVDDAFQNVKAVQSVLSQLDVKSKVVQAFSKRINGSNKEFNEMIERRKGVGAEKVFSSAEARKRGSQPSIVRFLKSLYIPPSAEDFKGLLYYFLGKGNQGDADMRFFADTLLNPFAKGIKAWNRYKQNMVNDYKALKKEYPNIRKNLNKKVPGTSFTNDTAIRTYLWTKAGFDIPGISKSLQKVLVEHVNLDIEMKSFAEGISIISKRPEGYIPPSEHWMLETIPTDLRNLVDRIGRKEFLKEWVENKNIIFSQENLNKIQAMYGDAFSEALKNILYRMENGGHRPEGRDRDVNWFTNWINGSVGAIMFFNMRSALLQTISTVNFINWSDNNIFKASAAFANQPQFWKDFVMLFNSDMLKQRRKGLQTDVSASELTKSFAEKGYSPQTVINWLLQIGFTPTQIADSFAIAFGGATFYRNRYSKYTKEGMSNKEAHDKSMLDFQEIAEETQQSSREDLISNQQASVLGRIVLAFQNVTMQYGRLTKKSLSDLINGRGDAKTNISKIIYYGMVQNVIFAALQSALAFMIFGGEDDELIEDKTTRTFNSVLDSFLRGTGLYGALVSTFKNTFIQWKVQKDKPWGKERIEKIGLEVINLSPPIGSKVRKIINAYYDDAWNEDLSEELGWRIENPEFSMTANLVEALTNVPLARVLNKANNLEEAITGNHETWKRVMMVLGWSQWELGVKDEEEEAAKKSIKEKKEIEKEKEKEVEKIEKEKEKKEKEKAEEEEKKKKGIKTIRCSGTNSRGERCGLTTETAKKTWKCMHHMEFTDGMDRDGDGIKEYRCKAITGSGNRCKNKTENKSKKCYAHQ